MLEPVGVDIVGSGKRLYFFSGSVGAVMRMQSFADCFGIQNSGNLEPAELENDRSSAAIRLSMKLALRSSLNLVTRARLLSSLGRLRSSVEALVMHVDQRRDVPSGGRILTLC